ncbi:MAG: glycosyltransferase, partial [bacterium]
DQPFEERRELEKVRAYHFAEAGIKRWVKMPLWINAVGRSERLDCVIALLTFANLAAIAARVVSGNSLHCLISEHNVPSVLLRSEGVRGRLQLALAKGAYRFADAAVAVSHPIAADLVGAFRVRPERVWVVPNPLTTAVVVPSAPPSCITVAFAGRLVKQKRPDRLAETLLNLQARGVSARGIVIGDGPLRRTLEELCSEYGVECNFVGWRDDWRSFAKSADCLLLPSDIEGFGNVLVEAAAVGLPVVACSRALGVADAIVPGMTGVLAVSTKPADLADAVLQAAGGTSPSSGIERWLSWFSTANSCSILEKALVSFDSVRKVKAES